MNIQHRSTTTRRMAKGSVAAAVIAAALLLPLSASPFVNLQLALIAAYAVAIRGLDVLTGHAGQASLGQSAFIGLGAYIAAYGFGHGWSPVVSLVAAVVAAGLVGVAVALPAVRLRGFAFGTITLALPVVGVPLAARLEGLTGGSQGVAVTSVSAPEGTGLADDQWHYYVVLVLAALAFLLVHIALRGRIGRGLDLLRTDETVASSVGIPVMRYKILAFAICSLCGGVAGWLYLVAVEFTSPETVSLNLSVFMLVAVVVGGLRSPLGSVIGAAFYVFVPNITDKVAPGRSFLVFGVALLIVLIFFPRGVSGAVRWLVDRCMPRRSATSHLPRTTQDPSIDSAQGQNGLLGESAVDVSEKHVHS